jgi:hypothetical protein
VRPLVIGFWGDRLQRAEPRVVTVLDTGLLLASDGDLSGYLSTFGGIECKHWPDSSMFTELVPGYELDAAMRR